MMRFDPTRLWTFRYAAAWALLCWLSFRSPGDEYGLWAISSVLGVWGLFIKAPGDARFMVYPVLAAGFVTTAALGWLHDWLRVSWRWTVALALLLATVFFFQAILAYPTLAKAISKNGSYSAYLFASLNVGLSLSLLVMPVGVAVARALPCWNREGRETATESREERRNN